MKIKINLAKSAGFCFGVRRALKIALDTARSKQQVCMLGDIVHNEEAAKVIREAGVKKIEELSRGKNKTLLIRAHGMSSAVIARAKKMGYEIVDATCPMVQHIHKIVREMEAKGYKIIVIGDKNHDEVRGIVGQLKNKAIVIGAGKMPALRILRVIKKAAVVAQSTQNMREVLNLVAGLKKEVRKLKFFNTVCMPTRMKQQEMRKMPLENDLMLVIGSKTSANTKRLYEIAKALNTRSYWISSQADIYWDWFKGIKNAGITSGSSTPDAITREVIRSILRH